MWGSHCGLTGYTYIMACFGERLNLHLGLQRHRDSLDQCRVMATSNWFQPHPLQTFLLAGEVPLRKCVHCICGSSCMPLIPCKTVCFTEHETTQSYKPHLPAAAHTICMVHWICSLSLSYSIKEPCHHTGTYLPPEVLTILRSNL